jgi:hypothetical protein
MKNTKTLNENDDGTKKRKDRKIDKQNTQRRWTDTHTQKGILVAYGSLSSVLILAYINIFAPMPSIFSINIFLVCPIWLPLFSLFFCRCSCNSSKQSRDLKPQPLDCEPSTLTTSPWLLATHA